MGPRGAGFNPLSRSKDCCRRFPRSTRYAGTTCGRCWAASGKSSRVRKIEQLPFMFDTRLIRLPDQSHTHAHEHHQLVMSLTKRAEFGSTAVAGKSPDARLPGAGRGRAQFAGVGDNRMLIIDLGEDNPTPEDPDLLARLFEGAALPTPGRRLPEPAQLRRRRTGPLRQRPAADPCPRRSADPRPAPAPVRRAAALAASGPLDLERLDAHIVRNLARRITVAELAQVACLSPSHFHAQFKGQRRPDPHQYLLKVRLDCAARLLRGKPPASGADRRGMRLLQPERADHGDAPLPGADAGSRCARAERHPPPSADNRRRLFALPGVV